MPNQREEKFSEFVKAAQPLLDFINKYCCPHDTIIVQMGSAELLNGDMCTTYPVPD